MSHVLFYSSPLPLLFPVLTLTSSSFSPLLVFLLSSSPLLSYFMSSPFFFPFLLWLLFSSCLSTPSFFISLLPHLVSSPLLSCPFNFCICPCPFLISSSPPLPSSLFITFFLLSCFFLFSPCLLPLSMFFLIPFFLPFLIHLLVRHSPLFSIHPLLVSFPHISLFISSPSSLLLYFSLFSNSFLFSFNYILLSLLSSCLSPSHLFSLSCFITSLCFFSPPSSPLSSPLLSPLLSSALLSFALAMLQGRMEGEHLERAQWRWQLSLWLVLMQTG